jgi:hypothetical protein
MPGPLKQIAVIPVIDAGADDHRAFAPHFFLQRSIVMRNAVLDTNFGGTDGSPESSACHKRSAGVGRHNKLGWRLGGNFGGLTVTPARRQTPPEWMSFHYMVRAKQWPRMRHTHFHRLLADVLVSFPQ